MSWAVSRSIGDAVPVGALADRLAGPEEVGHPAPVERCDRGMDELAAEVFGPVVVDEDRRDVLVGDEAVTIERHEVLRVGSDGPRPDGLGPGPGLGREVLDRDTGRPGRTERREQPELDAEVDEPGAVEPAKAVDQVVEAVVERHGRGIVAWRLGPSRYRSDTKRAHGATVRRCRPVL